jgi:MFS transporter, PCFT/HCP family, solute carrier family 46 (folate transporter), member 1
MEGDDQNILVENNVNNNQGHGKLRKFKLEPALLLLFFGYNLSSAIIPNQLLKQTCLQYGYNATDCSELGLNNATKAIEQKIQPHVAEIIMVSSLLNAIIPAVLSLFLGPWTDKFGRKKVICATFFGFAMTLAMMTIVSFISDHRDMINPWIYVFPYIPMIITGGWPTMIVSILCYVTDLSNEVNRSSRLALIEMIIFLGVLVGTFSSSFVLKLTCPTVVFLISAACALIASVYAVVFVDESVQVTETTGACGQIKELCSPAPVIEMMKTCFKRRSFKERRILWCLITILMFTVFTLNGSSNVFYLFVREKFNWSLKEATMFDSTSILVAIIGVFIGITVFKKALKCSDVTLAFIAIISMIGDSLIKAYAETSAEMYAASGICLFKILTAPMCRSLIATVVPNNEIGKVFSLTSSFEAVSSLIASPLYTYIYAKTFMTFAGAFFLITAGVYVISLVLIYCVMRMKQNRESLINPYTQIIS